MTITKELRTKIYESFKECGSSIHYLMNQVEKDNPLNCRALMAELLDDYRKNNNIETTIYGPEDVEKHNSIVNQIVQMETVYAELMELIEAKVNV